MTQKPKGKPLSRLTDAERHKRFVAMAKEVGSPAIGLGAWRVRRGGPRGLALALQLHFDLEMGAACFGLVSSSPRAGSSEEP